MKRVLVALALALVSIGGTASADTFRVMPGIAASLPSADVPNQPGEIAVPQPLSTAPAQPERLDSAQLQTLWQQAGASYGVPWQVLAAINKVESNFGRNMGPSSAGAIGWMQFMPSTWMRWGLDANGDGVADPWTASDAIFAAARYLAASGGATDIERAVFSYNHAQWYVDEVMQLSRVFGAGGTQTTFRVDRVEVSLAHARRAVARANARLVRAVRVERALSRKTRIWQRRAARAGLLSDRLALEKAAAQAGAGAYAAKVRVERLRARVQDAADALQQAETRASRLAVAPSAAAPLLDGPAAQGNYVFPVGGGAAVVSVAHTHHDYPAADIAAPEGSPEYALSDAVVLRAWQYPDPRCGIGLTLRTSDGLSWTYCHLGYLEPNVHQGTTLAAGALVGLVGHTGDATGPHLHLQLNPPTRYPQDEPWFRSFAGTAFRWQDAPTPRPAGRADGFFAAAPPQRGRSNGSVIGFTR